MKAKRRRHDPQFKAKVALEALRGVKTIQEIAKEFEVHPVQVSDWKKTMLDGVAGVFVRGSAANSPEDAFAQERERLHAKIGQLTIEKDFLEKKSRMLGL